MEGFSAEANLALLIGEILRLPITDFELER
jgi:hypothetical protein